jgi:hypothetical protein
VTGSVLGKSEGSSICKKRLSVELSNWLASVPNEQEVIAAGFGYLTLNASLGQSLWGLGKQKTSAMT